MMQARKLPPPSPRGEERGVPGAVGHPTGSGRWRAPEPRPTRGAQGPVQWWKRPAPEGSDPALWAAVQRVQARRMQLGLSVRELARRCTASGHPLRRETLSRVLNGKQPTSWQTVRRLAELVGIDVADAGATAGRSARPAGAEPGPARHPCRRPPPRGR